MTLLRRIRNIVFCAVLLTVTALLLLFAVNNHAAVVVSLFPLPYEAQMPLFLIVILFFCAGMLAGGAALSIRALRMYRLLAASRERQHALENEVESLRHRQEMNASLPVPVE